MSLELSPETVRALDNDLSRLKREQHELQEKIRKIESLLSGGRKQQRMNIYVSGSIPASSGTVVLNSGTALATSGMITSISNVNSSGSSLFLSAPPTSFRDRIRDVVKSYREGIRPTGVTQILTAQGYKVNGTTDLSVRVSSELWRLEKAGEIEKCSDGSYRMAEMG